jgi:Flp pilus assembly protein TadD
MKKALALVTTVVVMASTGCASEPTPPPAAPATTPPPPAEPAPPIATVAAPAPEPQKQLITVTTKSPDAKAALLKALDLSDNGRTAEALDLCKQALSADSDFAFAHACIGMLTSGAAAQAEADKGVQLAASLPEAERLFIEAQAAFHRQDLAKGNADVKRVAELAPDDARAHATYAFSLFDQRDFDGAAAAFKKGLALNPSAFYLDAMLAWTDMSLRQYDEALAAAHKYVEGAPNEPAAHQVVGVALLNLNKPKDAEAELAKALDLGPKMRFVYYDLATVKATEGDFDGARDVLDKSKAAEAQDNDALERARRTAWIWLAEGKQPKAFAVLDAAEKDADARKLAWPAYAATTRAWALWALGKPGDALKVATAATPRCDRPESAVSYKAICRFDLLTVQALSQVSAGKAADARKTVAQLQDELKNWTGNEWNRARVSVLADEVTALENKDKKAAAALLAKCLPDDVLFKYGILRQAEKAGDKAGADQARQDLLSRPHTDPEYPLLARQVKKPGG